MNKQKTALLFHGFPLRILPHESPLYQYFYRKNYRIVAPDLFDKKNILHFPALHAHVRNLLHGIHPDVIAGISIGGLIAPSVAAHYPEAKLILICSGPYIKTDVSIYNTLIRLESKDPACALVRIAKLVPGGAYRWMYAKIHRRDASIPKFVIQTQADKNLKGFRSIPISKVQEALRFVTRVDNTHLLRHLPNDTLLIAGSSDKIMPLHLSLEMNRLIPRSQLIYADRSHYDVFTEKEFCHLEIFLASHGHANA